MSCGRFVRSGADREFRLRRSDGAIAAEEADAPRARREPLSPALSPEYREEGEKNTTAGLSSRGRGRFLQTADGYEIISRPVWRLRSNSGPSSVRLRPDG